MTLSALSAGTIAQSDSSQTEAQQQDETKVLETVVVAATRSQQDIQSVPAKITIIDRATIRQQQLTSVNLFDLLAKLVPGFSPSRQKLTGFGESFRGRSPLFLIDGVPQTNPLRDGSRDGVTIDPDVIERIEIIHGPNAIQGLGATGGVINLITLSAEPSGELNQHAEFGLTSADDFDGRGIGLNGNYRLSKDFGQFDLVSSFSYTTRELFFDGQDRPVGIDNTQGDLSDSDAYNWFLKSGYDIDENQRLQFTWNDFRLRQDGDFITVDGDRELGISTSTAPGTPPGLPAENDVSTLTMEYSHADLAGGRFNFQVYYQDFEAVFGGGTFGVFQDPRIAEPGSLFDQSANKSRKLGTRLTYSRSNVFDTPVNIISGIDFVRDETEQSLILTDRAWVPETTFFDYAPFIQAEYQPLSWLNLSAGVRYEIANLEVDDFVSIAGNTSPDFDLTAVSGGSPSFDEPLFNAGFVIDPLPWLSLYGTFSEGFAMPDVGRVLRAISVPGTDVDDFLQLNPIISDNLEGGLRINYDRLSFQFSYFDSDSNEGSRLVANDDGIFDVARQRTSVEGIELGGEYAVLDNLSLGFNYTRLNGRFDSDGDDTVDSDLGAVDIAPDRLNIYLQARPLYWLGLNIQVSTLFDQNFENAIGETTAEFDGYTTVDLFLTSQFDRYEISLGVENLLDEFYITYFGQAGTNRDDRFFAGTGRQFSLRLAANF